MRALSYIGAEKITFPPKPDIHTDRQTDIHTDRRTDISVYRVDSLLKSILEAQLRYLGCNSLTYSLTDNVIAFSAISLLF